jgi:hydrogenase maturation protease
MGERLLIFAYGNPSRGDDALGPELLARLEAERDRRPDWGGIEIQTDFQLQIEHALDLEGQELALFIDASVSCAAPFSFARIQPEEDRTYSSHALSPAAVLRVWEQVKGLPAPPAYLLTVRGYAFELGEPISEAARANLEAAFRFAVALCDDRSAAHWERVALA